jgi:hypothetical protein
VDHVRIDPKFRRRPRPKRAGWAAREVFKFLLEVSAEFDLHGRFSASMQDSEWLTDEWTNGDKDARGLARQLLTEEIPKLVEVGLLHREADELVVSDWEDFYKPAKTGAQRMAALRGRAPRDESDARDVAVTPVTKPVTRDASDESDATAQHSTTQHSTEQQQQPAPVAAPAPPAPPPVEAAPPPPRGPLVYEKPTAPPEAWTFEEFERWFQWLRQEAGLPAERQRPHMRKGSVWWNECLSTPGVDGRVMKRAAHAYGKDAYWEAQGFPLRGFMSQWDTFVSKEKARATAS